jgi:hypothetical protein
MEKIESIQQLRTLSHKLLEAGITLPESGSILIETEKRTIEKILEKFISSDHKIEKRLQIHDEVTLTINQIKFTLKVK